MSPSKSSEDRVLAELVREGLIDMTGQRFGRLVVTSYAGKRGAYQTGASWHCKCDCGGEKTVSRRRLMSGQTKSCGCLATQAQMPVNLVGKRFGLLVVTGYAGRSKHTSFWNCECDCGASKRMSRDSLVNGCSTTSCGCRRRNRDAALAPRVPVANVVLSLDDTPKFRACEPGIYILFCAGELVYIGQSRNVFERVAHHERRGILAFDHWDFVVIDDPGTRFSVEQELIRQHLPRYNQEAKAADFRVSAVQTAKGACDLATAATGAALAGIIED